MNYKFCYIHGAVGIALLTILIMPTTPSLTEFLVAVAGGLLIFVGLKGGK